MKNRSVDTSVSCSEMNFVKNKHENKFVNAFSVEFVELEINDFSQVLILASACSQVDKFYILS